MAFMTPDERAESLREALQLHIDLVEGDATGPSWTLTDKGFAKIAAGIRDAADDALERAATLCEASRLGERTHATVSCSAQTISRRESWCRESLRPPFER